MAHHLAEVYGTAADGVHCRFYLSSGRCPNPSVCERFHPQPAQSRSIIIPHLFHGQPLASENDFQNFFEDFCIHLVAMCNNFPTVLVKDLIVCSNSTTELRGNVYLEFYTTDQAAIALENINQLQLQHHGVIHYQAMLCAQVVIEDTICQYEDHCPFYPACYNVHAVPMQPNLRWLLGFDEEEEMIFAGL